MDDHAPFSQSFDLASLGEAERVVKLAPSADERAAIAAWAGINALDAFSATVRLRRTGTDSYAYEASFTADVTQSCVVTLEPLRSHLEGTATREFHVVSQRARRRAEPEEEVIEGSESDVDTLTTNMLDIAAPVLEEFALTIDPYPRAPGAVFDAPSDPDQSANPFAALEKLKRKE